MRREEQRHLFCCRHVVDVGVVDHLNNRTESEEHDNGDGDDTRAERKNYDENEERQEYETDEENDNEDDDNDDEEEEEVWTCSLCETSYPYCCLTSSLTESQLLHVKYLQMLQRKLYLLCPYCSEQRTVQLFDSLGQILQVTQPLREANSFRNAYMPHMYCDCQNLSLLNGANDENDDNDDDNEELSLRNCCDEQAMIECDICGEWYHEQCVQINLEEIDEDNDRFVCRYCSGQESNGHMIVNRDELGEFYSRFEYRRVKCNNTTNRCNIDDSGCINDEESLKNMQKKRKYDCEDDNVVVQCLKRRMLMSDGRWGAVFRKSQLQNQLIRSFHSNHIYRHDMITMRGGGVDEEPWAMTSIITSSNSGSQFCVGTHEGNILILELDDFVKCCSAVGNSSNNHHEFDDNGGNVTMNASHRKQEVYLTMKHQTPTSCAGFSHLTMCPSFSSSLVFGSDWYDSVITVLDLELGKEIYSCDEHCGPVRSFDHCSRVNCLMTSSFDKTVRLWDGRLGFYQSEAILKAHTRHVTGAYFLSDDATHFVSVSDDSTMKVWDLRMITEFGSENRACVRCFDFYPHRIISMTMSDDRQVTAINVDNGQILTYSNWELRSGSIDIDRPRNILVGHKNQNWRTIQARFIPGTDVILCGSEDGNMCVWHESSRDGVCQQQKCYANCVWSSCYLPSSNMVVCGSSSTALYSIELFQLPS